MPYHINPETGKVSGCRVDPSNPRSRGCKFGMGQTEHYATMKEAGVAMEQMYDDQSAPLSKNSAKRTLDTSPMSQQQKEYFSQSKAIDDNGNLMVFHHGATADFTSFSPDYVGKGNDQWGAGFYFTSKEESAQAYAEGNTIKSFYLNLKNLSATTGHDGIIVDFEDGERFAIAWRPEQIKSASNTSPTNTAKFDK